MASTHLNNNYAVGKLVLIIAYFFHVHVSIIMRLLGEYLFADIQYPKNLDSGQNFPDAQVTVQVKLNLQSHNLSESWKMLTRDADRAQSYCYH